MREYAFRVSLILTFAAAARADLGVPVSTAAPLNANAATDTGGDFSPRLASDGNGNWVAVWYSNETLGGPIGGDFEIFVARSVDNGLNWSLPVPLNNNAASDTNTDVDPDIATDGKGHWVAVWSKNSAPSFETDIVVARSIDNGATWSDPVALNANAATDAGNDIGPTIVTDGLGHWVAVWYSDDTLGNTLGNDFDIFVSRSIDNGEHWSAPAPLNNNAGGDSGADYVPAVVTDGLGHWVVAWASTQNLGGADTSDSDILVARSIDNGANWSSPVPLNTNALTDGDSSNEGVALATDSRGNWIAIFSAFDANSGASANLAARSIDNGANWSSPVPVEVAESGAYYSLGIAAGADGHWVAAWVWNINGTQGGEITVRMARSIDNGQHWSTGTPVSGDSGFQLNVGNNSHIATDRRGQWLVAWSPSAALGGSDADILSAHFALPDCNNNLIGDPLETATGMSPDINDNGRPDVCEVLGLPPAGGGCGGGPCGVGSAAFAPVTLLGLSRLRRSPRRNCKGTSRA